MTAQQTNILLVEDDVVNQLVASSLLRKWGAEVSIAKNGAEAVTQIQSKIYQLVLMDLQMPVMDGFESSSRIRAMDDSYFKNIPIIACTASGLIEAQGMAMENGMNDIVTKPLNPEELRNKINKYISQSERPLFIDFNLYTDGDADFKKELVRLLIDNIRELQQSLAGYAQSASKIFLEVVHKVKATVGMLSDQEFSSALDEVKAMCVSGQTGEPFRYKVNHLVGLCDQVVKSLSAEA